ncbi:MAG TPA: PAS domain-containing protein [Aldersonia sp.]
MSQIEGPHGRRTYAGAERRRAAPDTLGGYLAVIPTPLMLDRLPVPILAVHRDATIVYANPAFAAMTGYSDLAGRRLAPLLAAADPGPDPVEVLRAAAATILALRHADGTTVRAWVSESVFLRADDPVVLVAFQDRTEQLWIHGPGSTSSTQN